MRWVVCIVHMKGGLQARRLWLSAKCKGRGGLQALMPGVGCTVRRYQTLRPDTRRNFLDLACLERCSGHPARASAALHAASTPGGSQEGGKWGCGGVRLNPKP